MDYGQVVTAMLCGVCGCRVMRHMPVGTSKSEMSAAAMPHGWRRMHDGDDKWRWYCPVHAGERRAEHDSHTVKK